MSIYNVLLDYWLRYDTHTYIMQCEIATRALTFKPIIIDIVIQKLTI